MLTAGTVAFQLLSCCDGNYEKNHLPKKTAGSCFGCNFCKHHLCSRWSGSLVFERSSLVSLFTISYRNNFFWHYRVPVLLHSVWRFLLDPLFLAVIPGTPIAISKIVVKPRPFIRYLNSINLKGLSNRGLLIVTLIALLTILVFFLFPSYPFSIVEDPPIVQEFSVQYLSVGQKKSYHPGDTIQAKDQILVEAKIIGACTLPCKWSSSRGSLLPGKACSVLYTSSVAGGMDDLTVAVQSPCKTIQTTSTIFITP